MEIRQRNSEWRLFCGKRVSLGGEGDDHFPESPTSCFTIAGSFYLWTDVFGMDALSAIVVHIRIDSIGMRRLLEIVDEIYGYQAISENRVGESCAFGSMT